MHRIVLVQGLVPAASAQPPTGGPSDGKDVRAWGTGTTPTEVYEVLLDNPDDLGVPGEDLVYGHGRVNARRAVQ